MLVKEFISGKKMPKESLYKVELSGPRGGKRSVYFLNREAYEDWSLSEYYRRSFIDNLVKDYGYISGMPVPTIIFSKLKELKPFGYEAIYNTYEKMKVDIYRTVVDKHFDSETGMFTYIMAIIKNNVMPEYRKIQRREKLKAEKAVAEKAKQVITDFDIAAPKNKPKDLSDLLGDI